MWLGQAAARSLGSLLSQAGALLSSPWRLILSDFIKLPPSQLESPGEQGASFSV